MGELGGKEEVVVVDRWVTLDGGAGEERIQEREWRWLGLTPNFYSSCT